MGGLIGTGKQVDCDKVTVEKAAVESIQKLNLWPAEIKTLLKKLQINHFKSLKGEENEDLERFSIR